MKGQPRISVRGLSKRFIIGGKSAKSAASTNGAALNAILRAAIRPGARGGNDRLQYFYALRDLDFDVASGEVLGVIGRNGAGKSTLLRVLAQTFEPSAGKATLRGRVVSLLELGLGFAPDLTVRENIQFYGRLAGFGAKQVDAAEERILDMSKLGPYRETVLEHCPSGSFVRLAFSAMISLDADIVLADEVLTVGDSEFRKQCEQRIREVGRSGESVLFVSHDMEAIKRICTRVIWLDRGMLRMDGATEDVVAAYSRELLAGRLLAKPEAAAGENSIVDLRLLDDDKSQTGALQITRASTVECLVRIANPRVPALLEIELWMGKALVFLTGPRAPLGAKGAGTYKAGFTIPANFLNEATYLIRARLLSYDPEGEGDGAPETGSEETLEFTAFNSDPEASVWANWDWGRGGVVSPRLTWRRQWDAETAGKE